MRSYECETGVCKLLRGLQRGASGLVNDGGGAGHIDEGHPSLCSPIGDSYTLTVKGGWVRTFFPFIIADTHTHLRRCARAKLLHQHKSGCEGDSSPHYSSYVLWLVPHSGWCWWCWEGVGRGLLPTGRANSNAWDLPVFICKVRAHLPRTRASLGVIISWRRRKFSIRLRRVS